MAVGALLPTVVNLGPFSKDKIVIFYLDVMNLN